MSIASYKDCLEGARTTLTKYLNIQPEEKMLIVKSPFDVSVSDLMAVSSVLWWCKIVHAIGLDCEKALRKLMNDRMSIQNALTKVAEERGCVTFSRTIDTSTMLDAHFDWESKKQAKNLLKTMAEADVIIDLTLLGLDQLPPTKKSREPHLSFKEEIRKRSEARGVDMHLASRSSFAEDGPMCFDLTSIVEKLKKFKEKIRRSTSLELKSTDTDLKLNIDEDKVDVGSGIIRKPREWHFLPSGVVFVPVEVAGTFGKMTLDGSIYGIGSLKNYPMKLQISPGTERIEDIQLADNTPYHIKRFVEEMFKIKECRHIAEVVIGFNPLGGVNSIEPMEFYVAEGNVTIALGRNDHIGGKIYPTDPAKASIHIHASISNPTLTLSNGKELVKRGKLIS